MTLGTIAALVCIILGFVSAIIEEHILLAIGQWFLVAIPFALLGGPVVFRRGG